MSLESCEVGTLVHLGQSWAALGFSWGLFWGILVRLPWGHSGTTCGSLCEVFPLSRVSMLLYLTQLHIAKMLRGYALAA